MRFDGFRRSVALAAILIFLLFFQPFINAQQKRPHTNIKRPKLVLIIILDQFRADYLSRFSHLFGTKGFKRLMANGAYFTNANYPYANTLTAVGHSTILSGSIPAIHGVIGNRWYDRETKDIRRVVADTQVRGLGTEKGVSPSQLLTTTLGDQLRLSNNYQSQVIGISIKDRAAAIIAGRRGSAAYWFDSSNGAMVSSSYFLQKLPDWVITFNQQHIADQYFQQQWQRKLPAAAYKISDRDDAPYEDTWAGNTTSFPHIINGNQSKISPEYYDQFTGTPFANELLAKFTLKTIEEERLGQGEYTDLLAVSFSAPDLAGHMFGPYSQEVQDMTLRLDDLLASLLDEIDRKLGLNNVLLALTADHGVSPIPEYMQTHGMSGRRIMGDTLRASIETALGNRYGAGDYVQALVNHQIYLNEKLIEEKKLNPEEVEDLAGKAALKVAGIANYFTRTQILKGQLPATPLNQRIMAAFHAQRSGNLVLLVEPFTLIVEASDEMHGTAHGTPYHYDTHVPIIISGPQVKAGVYQLACSPADITPTLAAILKIEPPAAAVGRILTEALSGQP